MTAPITYAVCEKCGGLNRIAFEFPSGKSPICGKCKNALILHHGVSDLSVSSLETITSKSPLPVVVDFWAPWCGPCLSFAPTFIKAAQQLKGRFVFGKLDTQAHASAGVKFGVRGIPTVIAFNGGKEIGRTSGALSADELIKWLNHSVNSLAEERL